MPESLVLPVQGEKVSDWNKKTFWAIISAIPYPWRLDAATQGWKKMFFLDPGAKLRQALVETQ